MDQARQAVDGMSPALSGWARARRDLLADWRGWSAGERSAALAGAVAAALLPLLIYGGLAVG
jgi:hypothetical protein